MGHQNANTNTSLEINHSYSNFLLFYVTMQFLDLGKPTNNIPDAWIWIYLGIIRFRV